MIKFETFDNFIYPYSIRLLYASLPPGINK